MVNADTSPIPAIALAAVLLLSAFVGVMVVDSLITSSELRKAARRLREFPAADQPMHTEN